MINEFTKANVEIVEKDIEAVLEVVAKKHGLKINMKGGRYGTLSFTPKFELIATSVDGDDKYQTTFKAYAEIYGLKTAWLGEEIKIGRSRYTVAGLDDKKRKYKIQLKSVRTGELHGTTASHLISILG